MSARDYGFQEMGLPDIERRVANMIRIGRISAVDLPNKSVRVQSGNLESAWLRWPAGRAGGGKRRWDAPEVGEQVVMLSPTGDMSQAVVVPGLYQDSFDAPSSDANVDMAVYGDGAVFQYDRGTHTLTVDLGGSSVIVNRSQMVLTVGASALTITPSGSTLQTPLLTVDSPISTFTGLVSCAALQMTGAGGGAATLSGNVNIEGNVTTTGSLINNGKDVGGTHGHTNVQPGSGVSGGVA